VNSCQDKRSKEHLEVRGIAVIEDDGLHHQIPWKGDVHHLDARFVRSSRLAALPVGRGRGGEGWVVEDSTRARAHSGKASEATLGQPKCRGSEREVVMTGHQENSAGGRRELCPGEPRHIFGKGKGDTLASSRVQKALENNEAGCYSTDKVSKAREAHIATHLPYHHQRIQKCITTLPAAKQPHPQPNCILVKVCVSRGLRS
jgi:hypothetical protein